MTEIATITPPTPPKHLSAPRKALWRRIITDAAFHFQAHHLTQLELLCQALDRAEQARAVVAAEGLTLVKKNGDVIAHPAVAVERESMRTALRAVAVLKLDDDVVERPGHKRAAGVYR
jgi:P27 family predicted phage terminase small subunit